MNRESLMPASRTFLSRSSRQRRRASYALTATPAEFLEQRRLLTGLQNGAAGAADFTTAAVEQQPAPAGFEIRFSDGAGQPLSHLAAGDTFHVHVDLRDQRSEPLGVFSAYTDVEFDASLMDVREIDWHLPLQNPSGPFERGLIDEAGGITGSFAADGKAVTPVLTMKAVATQAGLLTVSTNAPDAPFSQVVLFGLSHDLRHDVEYAQAELPIHSATEPLQLNGAVLNGSQLVLNYDVSASSMDPFDAVLMLEEGGVTTELADFTIDSDVDLTHGSHQIVVSVDDIDFSAVESLTESFALNVHLASPTIQDVSLPATGVIETGSRLLVIGSDQADRLIIEAEQLEFHNDAATVAVSLSGIESVVGHMMDGDDQVSAARSTIPLTIHGGTGADSVAGGTGADRLHGGAGHDRIQGGGGNDRIYGGDGDDALVGDHGRDWIDGQDGHDTAMGAAHNDTLIGAAGVDYLDGQGASHDVLIVNTSDASESFSLRRVGSYTAIDEVGHETFSSRFRRTEHVLMKTFGGDDAIVASDISHAGYFKMRVWLGDGNDSFDLSESANEQIISIVVGGAGDEKLTGGPGRDRLRGDDGRSTLVGNGGDDTLAGGDNEDVMNGGSGEDRLLGFGGDDSLAGGADRDWLYGDDGDDEISGGDGRDRVVGGRGHDRLSGGRERDTLLGDSGDDTLDGGQGHDALSGSLGNDLLLGGSGFDTLVGGDGSDSLFGGTGNDILLGGADDDTGSGQRGDDTVSGGAGVDTIEASPDEIDEAFQFDAWWLQDATV